MRPRGLDIELERAIDAQCDDFERALQAGQHPPINECLAKVPESAATALALELLHIAVEYAGTRPIRRPATQDEVPAEPNPDEGDSGNHRSSSPQSVDAPPSDASADIDREPQAKPFGNYELFDEIGTGGMGTVYRARDRSLNRVVALKLLHPQRWRGLSSEQQRRAVRRFTQEACAASRQEHPNIVSVYEGDCVDGAHYLAMQFVAGRTLAELVGEAPLESRRAAAYLEPVCRALHAVHSAGVLHRDIKPSNIIVEEGSDRPLLMDFGLAKVLSDDQDLTLSGEMFGSPPYMAPEQVVNANSATIATDVYGIGATLYHLLTGRPPFQSTSVAGTLHQVLSNDVVPPRMLNSSIDRDIETVCLRCLEKRPQHRYKTALEVARELQRYLAGQPVEARPLNMLQRAIRWCQRHTAVAALLALLGASVGTAFIVVSILYLRERASTAMASRLLAENQRQLAEAYRRSAGLDETPPSTAAIAWLAGCIRIDQPGSSYDYADRVRIQRLISTSPALVQQVNHGAPITNLAVSRDSKTFVTGGADGVARLWRTSGDSACIGAFRHSETATLSALDITPEGDVLASGGTDGQVIVWSTNSGEHKFPAFSNAGTIARLVFSSDGRWLAAGSANQRACVWDMRDGTVLTSFPHQRGVSDVQFDSAGERLLTLDTSGITTLWTLPGGHKLGQSKRSRDPIVGCYFDLAGEVVVAAARSGVISKRSSASFDPTSEEFPLRGPLIDVRRAKNAENVFATAKDGTVLHWRDGNESQVPAEFRVRGHPVSTAVSDDGRFVAVATNHPAIEIWRDGDSIARQAEISVGSIQPLIRFLPREAALLAAGGTHARVWQIKDGDDTQWQLPLDNVEHAAVSGDRRLLIACDGRFRTVVTDLSPKGERLSISHDSRPLPSVCNCQSRFIVIAEQGGIVSIVDADGFHLQRINVNDLAPLAAVAISPDGSLLAVAGTKNVVRLISRTTSVAACRDIALPQRARHVLFNETSSRLFAICSDRIVLIDPQRTDSPVTAPLSSAINDVAFDTDTSLVVSCANGTLARVAFDQRGQSDNEHISLPSPSPRLWLNRTCNLCGIALDNHEVRLFRTQAGLSPLRTVVQPASVELLAISDSGQLLATFCRDSLIRVWDVNAGSLVCAIPDTADRNVYATFCDGDSKVLVINSTGGVSTYVVGVDNRPAVEIDVDARLLSGHSINERGILETVTPKEADDAWWRRSIVER